MNYESDKAPYWRDSDFWTFSEVQFLLNGDWPDRSRKPPLHLTVHLLEVSSEKIHDMGDGNILVEPITECLVVNPVPDHVQLPQMIEDAVTAGKLTAVEGRKKAWHKFDLEDRFRPAEVIAWANSRGCFPDFPFGKSDDHADADAAPHQAQAQPHPYPQPEAQAQAAQPAPAEVNSCNMVRWKVAKPQRYGGYRGPLHHFLKVAHSEGRPIPTAREVVDAWRTQPPSEIAKVLDEGIDYYDCKGGTKPASLEAIRKAIKRMTSGR